MDDENRSSSYSSIRRIPINVFRQMIKKFRSSKQANDQTATSSEALQKEASTSSHDTAVQVELDEATKNQVDRQDIGEETDDKTSISVISKENEDGQDDKEENLHQQLKMPSRSDRLSREEILLKLDGLLKRKSSVSDSPSLKEGPKKKVSFSRGITIVQLPEKEDKEISPLITEENIDFNDRDIRSPSLPSDTTSKTSTMTCPRVLGSPLDPPYTPLEVRSPSVPSDTLSTTSTMTCPHVSGSPLDPPYTPLEVRSPSVPSNTSSATSTMTCPHASGSPLDPPHTPLETETPADLKSILTVKTMPFLKRGTILAYDLDWDDDGSIFAEEYDMVTGMVNETECHLILDTSTRYSLISRKLELRMMPEQASKRYPAEFRCRVLTQGGSRRCTYGMTRVEIRIRGRLFNHPVVVTEMDDDCILGEDFAYRFQELLFMMKEDHGESVFSKFRDVRFLQVEVFADGYVNGVRCQLTLDTRYRFTVVSVKLARKMGKPKLQGRTVKYFSGNRIDTPDQGAKKCLFMADMDIKLGNTNHFHKCIVAEIENVDCILGIDFLNQQFKHVDPTEEEEEEEIQPSLLDMIAAELVCIVL